MSKATFQEVCESVNQELTRLSDNDLDFKRFSVAGWAGINTYWFLRSFESQSIDEIQVTFSRIMAGFPSEEVIPAYFELYVSGLQIYVGQGSPGLPPPPPVDPPSN